MRGLFAFLPDRPEVFAEWLQLVQSYRISGKQVHDARLVAVMRPHGLTHLLTLNGADFARFAEVVAVHPHEVLEALPPTSGEENAELP